MHDRKRILFTQAVDVGSRCINTAEFVTKNQKKGDKDGRDDQIGNEGRDQSGQRGGLWLVAMAARALLLKCGSWVSKRSS